MAMTHFYIFLFVDINKAYICRGRLYDSLKYDWLMMYLGGAVVNFYHVTLYYMSESEKDTTRN